MIVRDEGRVLARCIRSLAALGDELCVVDTGSRDRTVDIARELGASVKTFTACNGPDGRIQNFAQARNAALDMARGDWIFSVDADEVLERASGPRVRRSIQRTKVDALRVRLRSGDVSWLAVRLFRNDPRHRYVGRVHENVPLLASIAEARGVSLLHLPDKRGKEASNDRNLRLCQSEACEHPESTRALFYLANELRAAGRVDEALLRYTEQLALGGGFPTERYRALHCIAECHYLREDWSRAVEAGLRALSMDPRYAETHCLIGDAYFAWGQFAFARQWYASALSCREPPRGSPMFVMPIAYDRYPRAKMRECERRLRADGRSESRTNKGRRP